MTGVTNSQVYNTVFKITKNNNNMECIPDFYKEQHVDFETFRTKSFQTTPEHTPHFEKRFSQQFWK